MSYAFEIKSLVKKFGKVTALDGVTLNAEEGRVFGLLGPNGAGKTTIVRILSTLLDFDSGQVKVHGIDVSKNPELVRETIGLGGQFAAVDEYLTGYENIFMVGRLYGLNRSDAKKKTIDLLERFNLSEAMNRQVKTYSGGMKRRLDLGASLIGEPRILFLDEPTTGLDPSTRLDLWEIIRGLVKNGTSILLTTQYLEEADELANKIAVVNKGKVIAEGTSNELKAKLGGDVVEFQLTHMSDKGRALTSVKKFAKTDPDFDDNTLMITVPVKDGSKSLMAIVQALNDIKLSVSALSLHRPSLDDVFLSLTGHKTEAEEPNSRKRRKK
ncbi:MAG TPA: ATP-binding cassette domain-containing protein [Candidatus Saccharimonadia bacterium]|nr:ATP-binding cassette domain-containing protein [Candidatus Saccharimonadia bacterium]